MDAKAFVLDEFTSEGVKVIYINGGTGTFSCQEQQKFLTAPKFCILVFEQYDLKTGQNKDKISMAWKEEYKI